MTMSKVNIMHKSKSANAQQGAATLLVTVMLLIGVTLIALFATKVGILDQRISGNEYRHKEAFANAEAGLDQATAYLRKNQVLYASTVSWTASVCAVSTVDCYVPDSLSTVSVSSVLSGSQSYLVKTADKYLAVGVGDSADNTGKSMVQVAYAKSSLIDAGELPPLMLPTGTLSGNFNIVPNPNGGGEGVPVSVWSKDTLDTSGANWKTCHHGEFQDGSSVCMDTKGDGASGASWLPCACDDEISNSGDVNEDLVLSADADFPVSPFAYLFDSGNTVSDGLALRDKIKERAERTGLVLADCTTIVADFAALTTSALVWVEGDCIIGGAVVGSREKPIILVVEDLLRVNANSEVWGILLSLNDFVLNGGPVIHGSAISEIESDLTNGTYSQVYDEAILENLQDDSINIELVKQKYSWRDF